MNAVMTGLGVAIFTGLGITMQTEINDVPGVTKIMLVELVFTDQRIDPPVTTRLSLTLKPDGVWTAEGNLPLDQAAKLFVDNCVWEANRQGIRFVRTSTSP